MQYFLNIFCPKIPSFLIRTPNIGEGLFIWYGFSTALGAKSIGKNCMINHMVTIGGNNGHPTILDNVRIHAGAVIFGEITIGNNTVIGANCTVFKDIPDNSTVFSESSRTIRWSKKNESII